MPLIARLLASAADWFGAPAAAAPDLAGPAIAAAALLVHVARVDGSLAPVEHERLARLLHGGGLAASPAEALALIGRAIAVDDETRDFADLVARVGRDAPEAERLGLLGMAWAIAAADGTVHEFEDDLVWRLGQLLGFDDAAIAASRAIALAAQAPQGAAP
ncbi:TerB family tellurite resistance protein [Methylobacterium oryzihabitans]|uniref:Tellurite resistance protein TerB n=1 Tax=Methylobacterium oryzihabitans TaxID=2499852 RepID=A0A437PGY4_9HYPH|nr:TerB family tellurite resistance protein [Methylobacterium oryzihabitans]RVU21522.1 Tellurite resistance protein TerB [Methylobacterium oryzihabitans]